MRKRENGSAFEDSRGTIKDRAKDAFSMPSTKVYIGAFVAMLVIMIILMVVKF